MGSRPFAYNPGPTAISGVTNIGNLAVGASALDYSSKPGGLNWWMGPEESSSYVIAKDVPAQNFPTPLGNVGGVQFWRCSNTDEAFRSTVQTISGTAQASASVASAWLSSNGYWTSFAGVVIDGLVTYFDASIGTSYPGTGNTWFNLIDNGNNGALINGPTFSSANGGNIVFDGANDYADFTSPGLGTTTTVEMWCKIGAAYNSKMFFGWDLYDVWCGSSHLGYNTAVSDVYGISSASVSSLGLVNNWKHYVFEMRSDVSYTNNKIYINGTSQTLSQQAGTENAGNRNFNNGNGRIAIWGNNSGAGSFNMPMGCAVFKVYNRALTQTEINENYNATKSRFGL
jgi:hypothetical protein